MKQLPDVQASTEGFPNIPIQKVGVRHIRMPFIFGDGVYWKQSVLADFSVYCDLSEETKGINMSRMAETLFKYAKLDKEDAIPHNNLAKFASDLRKANNSNDIYVKASFSLVFQAETPSTSKFSVETLPVILETRLIGEKIVNLLQITYTGMSLCPCSKEMSLLINNLTTSEKEAVSRWEEEIENAHDEHRMSDEYRALETLLAKMKMSGFGAHNQKSRIEIKVEMESDWKDPIRALLLIAQKAVSFPTVAMLKRADEKFVTEASYMGRFIDADGEIQEVESAGPKFVEDISRAAAESLNKLLDVSIKDYVVVVNNEESIHSNDMVATAILSCGRGLK